MTSNSSNWLIQKNIVEQITIESQVILLHKNYNYQPLNSLV